MGSICSHQIFLAILGWFSRGTSKRGSSECHWHNSASKPLCSLHRTDLRVQVHLTKSCRGKVVVRGVLPGLRRRRTGLLPSGPKSSFQMRASFVFHLETKVLESGGRVEKLIAQVAWSPVLSFHSLWWFGVQCHLLVLVHCFFENQRHCTRLLINFGALHASFCWPAF